VFHVSIWGTWSFVWGGQSAPSPRGGEGTVPTAYNNTYRIMHHKLRNVSVRPHQVTHCVRTFDALLRNNLYWFLCDAHLHLTFLSVRFKCLMLFTNLHFSSIIQHSCMMETNCSSCWRIVSVFASHQYCFCVAKMNPVCIVYKPSIQKVRNRNGETLIAKSCFTIPEI